MTGRTAVASPAMENLPLVLGLGAAALVVFWIVKKLFKLALYAGIAGVLAWLWYFNVR